jgi:hypothetical protein
VAALVAWRRRERVPLVLALASLLVFAVYVVTPFTAQGPEGLPQVSAGVRYALPSLMLGAGACAWLLGRLGRGGLVIALLVVATFVQAIDVERRAPEFAHTTNLRMLAAAVALALLVVAARALRDRPRPALAPLALAAVAVAVAAVVVAGGRKVQQDFEASRYRVRPTYTWLQAVPKKPVKIGLVGRLRTDAGYGAQIASFGPRMRNDAEYVGFRREHMLTDYATEESFTAALERGRYQLLLVGVHRNARAWARAAGWRELVRDEQFTLFAAPKT